MKNTNELVKIILVQCQDGKEPEVLCSNDVEWIKATGKSRKMEMKDGKILGQMCNAIAVDGGIQLTGTMEEFLIEL